jgi:hypothetical protein
MTVPVPVPPEPEDQPVQVIHQTARGWLYGWTMNALSCLLLLLLLERAAGVDGPATNQLWIIPCGLLAAGASWRVRKWMAPRRTGSQLVVTLGGLEYRERGQEPVTIPRTRIGLVDVVGAFGSGRYVVTVHDHDSVVLARWTPRWSGWKQERVVEVLRDHGYPAARHTDIYDGRFQSQTAGEPPRMARP